MLILIANKHNIATVLDTADMTEERIDIFRLLDMMRRKKFRVEGINPEPEALITVDFNKSRRALRSEGIEPWTYGL